MLSRGHRSRKKIRTKKTKESKRNSFFDLAVMRANFALKLTFCYLFFFSQFLSLLPAHAFADIAKCLVCASDFFQLFSCPPNLSFLASFFAFSIFFLSLKHLLAQPLLPKHPLSTHSTLFSQLAAFSHYRFYHTFRLYRCVCFLKSDCLEVKVRSRLFRRFLICF